MGKTLVERVGTVSEFMDYDDTTGDLVIERVEDVQPVVDAVAQKASTTGGRSASGLMWHIGELPYAVWSAWGRMRGLPDNWVWRAEYAPEVVALVKANPRLSPTEGKC